MFAATQIDDSDISRRRERAIISTRRLVDRLAEAGVTAKIIGSLANGRFENGSDIDILITTCPRSLKYRIESMAEDMLDGFGFDVIYLDEIPAHRLASFTRDAIDAHDLR